MFSIIKNFLGYGSNDQNFTEDTQSTVLKELVDLISANDRNIFSNRTIDTECLYDSSKKQKKNELVNHIKITNDIDALSKDAQDMVKADGGMVDVGSRPDREFINNPNSHYLYISQQSDPINPFIVNIVNMLSDTLSKMSANGDKSAKFAIKGRDSKSIIVGFESKEKLNECLKNALNNLGKQYNVPISQYRSAEGSVASANATAVIANKVEMPVKMAPEASKPSTIVTNPISEPLSSITSSKNNKSTMLQAIVDLISANYRGSSFDRTIDDECLYDPGKKLKRNELVSQIKVTNNFNTIPADIQEMKNAGGGICNYGSRPDAKFINNTKSHIYIYRKKLTEKILL
jgi:hypothetical protein